MIVVILPARLDSVRLPAKALADIGGAPMIVRVWERARRARVDRVIVATDHPAIQAAVQRAGGEVILTGPAASGTDRVAMAARTLSGARVVVNVQGDEPLLDPDHIDAVAAAVSASTPIATAAAPLTTDPADPARVKVVRDQHGQALYFSRQPIPTGGPFWLHVGLYAFDAAVLQDLARLPVSPLETSERLEQLRWLEAGYRIQVVPIAHAEGGIDTPADLARVRAMWPV